MVGLPLSMLTVTSSGLLLLPATSTAIPETGWPFPSFASVTAGGQVLTPLPASVQLKVTETSVLFQPSAFGVGLIVDWIAGAVSSMLTLNVSGSLLLPALSIAVPVAVCPAPSF